MNLVLAFHKKLRISEFQHEIVPLRVNKESSLVGSMTHEMHLRRRHGLVTHWNCGQRRSGAGLRDLARSTSDCSIEIFHFWESLESLNNYLSFYDVLQHVLHYCLEISGKISVVKVFPPHEILGQVRFLSPEGQFSWGTRVWEHRMNPSFIKQAGCWLGEESTIIIFLNCLELYKPWWMACKERAADLRDHIYIWNDAGLWKKEHARPGEQVTGCSWRVWGASSSCDRRFGFVLGKAATWHMSSLKFAFCNIPLLLLKRSGFQPFQSWPTNLSSSTSRNLKYQGDGRFFCNGMDLQLLGRQRLHYWNVSLAHRGRQLGNLLPRYITANASQSTQIQTDAEKLMRRHMPRSTCQVSMCPCI